MAFKHVEIMLNEDNLSADELIIEYEKITELYREQGDNHGHTMVCQMFAHKDSDRKYYLSGRVLNREESDAFEAILTKNKVQ